MWNYEHKNNEHVYSKEVSWKKEAIYTTADSEPILSNEELDVILETNSRFVRNKHDVTLPSA